MAVFHQLGRWPWTLLVLAGFAAYWAGLDAAVGAWPLARGRHYSLTRLITLDRERARPDYDLDDED